MIITAMMIMIHMNTTTTTTNNNINNNNNYPQFVAFFIWYNIVHLKPVNFIRINMNPDVCHQHHLPAISKYKNLLELKS